MIVVVLTVGKWYNKTAMGFSATASFVASAVLGITDISVWRFFTTVLSFLIVIYL